MAKRTKDKPLSQLTNTQILNRMLKRTDPVYHAIVRSLLYDGCNKTIQDIQQHPEKWDKAFIHPDFMVRACNEIKLHLFDEPITEDNNVSEHK